MKKYYLLVLTFIYVMCVSAQDDRKDFSLKTYEKINLGINGMGVAVETPLSRKILSEFYVGVGPSYAMADDPIYMSRFGWYWNLLQPSFHVSAYGKYYYNRESRLDRKKSILLNTGNFIGLKVKYVSRTLSAPQFKSNTILTNLNWGFQRNLGKHWTYDFSFGLGFGYNMDDNYSMLYPAIELKCSYVLPFFDK